MRRATGALAALAVLALTSTVANAQAVRADQFGGSTLSANDDGSTGLVNTGISLNYFGATFTSVYVNNNGNITFTAPLGTFTPFNLNTTATRIIAPFFADVDTRGAGSALVTYGNGTVDGRNAFGVNWVGVGSDLGNGVGYFPAAADKKNKFQLVLIDRSDRAAGDFDIEFNYDQIQWETGGASGGVNGLGGNSARAGYSAGTGAAGTFFELNGSAVNGAFLDSNLATGLIHNSLNSNVSGRYLFTVTNGTVVVPGVPEPGEYAVMGMFFAGIGIAMVRVRRARKHNA